MSSEEIIAGLAYIRAAIILFLHAHLLKDKGIRIVISLQTSLTGSQIRATTAFLAYNFRIPSTLFNSLAILTECTSSWLFTLRPGPEGVSRKIRFAPVTAITVSGDMSQRFPQMLRVISSSKCPSMKTLLAGLTNTLMGLPHAFPAVSLIMPFDPKMSAKRAITSSIAMSFIQVEKDLHEHFPEEISRLVMQKLEDVLRGLDFSTHSISLAIFVSPVYEKILYLDFPVETRVVVGESFDIRDLVYYKKEAQEYLLLQLGRHECKLYLASPGSFVKLLSNTPRYDPNSESSNLSPVRRGSSTQEAKKTVNYLRYCDNLLDVILRAYPLPLFVLGNATLTRYFKGLTKHTPAVISYLHGNYETADAKELINIMHPQVADWRKVKEKHLLNQVEEAARNQQLSTGIDHVWHEAISHGGHLLVFERDHLYKIENTTSDKVINEALKPYDSFSCIKDQLDEVITRVLGNKGQVEFVDKDVLEAYDHVALLK